MPNDVKLQAYSSGTTIAEVPELASASGLTFDSFYPGGRYGAASFFVPCDVTRPIQLSGGYRIVARNGLTTAYEGYISSIGYAVEEGRMGLEIKCTGAWGWILESRTWFKIWADNRIDAVVWSVDTGVSDELYTDDRNEGRIRITPKSETQAVNDAWALEYSMPTGETIKRVTCARDFQESTKAYTFRLRDTAGAADVWSLTATTTDTNDSTLGTPRQVLQLQLFNSSGGAQAGLADGTEYGEISNVVVYSETGNINALEIGTDVIGKETRLNSSTVNLLSTATASLVPFITSGYEPLASILTRAAGPGDASGNAIAFYLRESDFAPTPDGKPVMILEAQPALTDYDYAVRVDEDNLVPPIKLERDFYSVRNWIIVSYQDKNGETVYVTPDDDATLTDTTSTTAYGQRDLIVDTGQVSETAAIAWGVRLLARLKDPKFYVSGPITVKGHIRAKSGQPVPASLVAPGKRVKIENFLTDLVGASGAGLTFLISHVAYNDDAQTAAISCGIPDDMAITLARFLDAPGEAGTEINDGTFTAGGRV